MSTNPRTVALERIRILYDLAKKTHGRDPILAKRYVQLIRKIAMRTRTHIPLEIKRGICKKCDTVLIQNITCHTRLRQRREPHIATTCHACGNVIRIPIRRKSE